MRPLMSQGLHTDLQQRLTLTPQMIQSIEILSLTQAALEERILHEAEENPVIDLMEPEVPRHRDEQATHEPLAPASEEDRWSLDGDRYGAATRTRSDDSDAPDRMQALASAPDKPRSLAEHLSEQLRFQEMSPEVRATAISLCWQLSPRGYLETPLEELFPAEERERAAQAWEHIRRCEPAGVGARDLKDCLMLQLAREPGDNAFEMALIRDHLDDVLKNRLPAIAQALGVGTERISEGVEVIALLDPKPGLAYAPGENLVVMPDAVVERNDDGSWTVSVPDGRLGKVRVDDSYCELYERSTDAQERSFLKDRISSARFLLEAVSHRRKTLLRVVSEIVKVQSAFLACGDGHLRPLTRRDIAEVLGLHTATVSRTIKDKYIQTPDGIMPIAALFSGSFSSEDGTETESSRSVRLRLREMIREEDRTRPLSDQEISDRFSGQGVHICRRTITKYRILDGIGSTRQRRQHRRGQESPSSRTDGDERGHLVTDAAVTQRSEQQPHPALLAQ